MLINWSHKKLEETALEDINEIVNDIHDLYLYLQQVQELLFLYQKYRIEGRGKAL